MAKGRLRSSDPVGRKDLETRHGIEQVRRRMTEYEEARSRAGITMVRVYPQRNQDGCNALVVYAVAEAVACLVGKDPVQANLRSAASAGSCGRWFQDSLRESFAPFTGLGQRVPAHETAWDWARNVAVASPGGAR